jgi:cyclohexyl-isocyanide hydratase
MIIHFLVFNRVEELDLVGAWEFAGLLAEHGYGESPKLVTLNAMSPVGEHGMQFTADAHFSAIGEPDVVFVPGGSGARVAMHDEPVISYLQERARRCKAVLSVCTGSFLMQKAGLLRGRRATTHWAYLDHLRADPDVEVVEQRYVRDGNIWTAGGVAAGMDMMLAFIAHARGESVAAAIQLYAEYFPSSRLYGRPYERDDVPAYIRDLGKKD